MILGKLKTLFISSYGIISLGFLVGAEYFLFSGNSFVKEWFYVLCWWPYIFFIDWMVHRREGNSILIDRRDSFIALVPASTFIWLIFEWFNLFLKNWHYVGLTSSLPLRWLGYFLSYGTVLLGIFETYELLSSFNVFSDKNISPPDDVRAFYPLLLILGVVSLCLCLAYPRYFFALVWGAFVFLLEPINHAIGAPSLLREIEKGSLQKFYLLLLSGLICGLLWEFWNFWAAAKWIYTVPFVGKIKLFEMPVLGFLGFPPFAVECYCMTSFLGLFFKSLRWEIDRDIARKHFISPYVPQLYIKYKRSVLSFFLICFYLLMFHAIDTHTVISFLSGR